MLDYINKNFSFDQLILNKKIPEGIKGILKSFIHNECENFISSEFPKMEKYFNDDIHELMIHHNNSEKKKYYLGKISNSLGQLVYYYRLWNIVERLNQFFTSASWEQQQNFIKFSQRELKPLF